MNEWMIVKNTKGVEVEISADRWEELKEQGYKKTQQAKREANKKIKTHSKKDNFDVLIIADNNGFYSGGRYHIWQIAHALAEYGLNVGFYTNRRPIFESDYEDYAPFTVILEEDADLGDINTNCYIATPIWGNRMLGNFKTDKDKYMLILDPVPHFKEFLPEDYEREKKYFAPMMDAVKQDDVTIIATTEYNRKAVAKWLDKDKDDIELCYAAVNSKIARKTKLVAVSRVVGRKNFDDLIELLSKLPDRFTLDIVTSYNADALQEKMQRYQVEDRVEVHTDLDDEAKFELFRSCDIMVNTSLYEGFGIWLIEGFALGKPVVAYDFPNFREIDSKSDNGDLFLAERRNLNDLVEKVLEAEDVVGFCTNWDMNKMSERMGRVFAPYKQTRIAWVADYFIEDRPGGAQVTNQRMIDYGRKNGFAIREIRTKEDFNPKDFDLIIANNIRLSDKKDRERIFSSSYIRYEHDYLDRFLKKDEVEEILTNSKANIFLSPMHAKRNQPHCHKENYAIPSPIDAKRFYKTELEKNNKAIWAGEIGVHKGIINVLEWADDHPEIKIDFYGWIGDDGEVLAKKIDSHPRCKYLGKLEHHQMPRKLRQYSKFIHLPEWHEPFGRAVMEAYLSGCEVITNDRVGAMSFNWDYVDYEDVKNNVNNSPELFWKTVRKYA